MPERKHLIWILFFGSLIGLHESFTGSFAIPYRSVILSSVTIILLSLARFKVPARGSTLAVITIALLFKMNHAGFQTCTTAWFLCGPTALLALGLMYELAATLLTGNRKPGYTQTALVCGITAMGGFVLFGAVSTYITGDWNPARYAEYLYLKAPLTIAVSGLSSMFLLYLRRNIRWSPALVWRPALSNSLLVTVILVCWLIGTIAA